MKPRFHKMCLFIKHKSVSHAGNRCQKTLPWVLSCLKTALYMQQVVCPQCYGCSREPEYSGYLAPNPGQPSAALTLYGWTLF